MKETEVESAKSAGANPSSQGPGSSLPLEPAPMSLPDLEDLKQRAAKADDHWERLLRTSADFDNYKKRAAREKADALKYANEGLMQKLIPVLDNLDNALNAAQSAAAPSAQSLQTGVSMVFQQLKGVLTEAGLEEVDALGKTFDPNLHEAIAQKETGDSPEGQVVEQVRKGYRLRERLLRPASVVVAKAPAP